MTVNKPLPALEKNNESGVEAAEDSVPLLCYFEKIKKALIIFFRRNHSSTKVEGSNTWHNGFESLELSMVFIIVNRPVNSNLFLRRVH